MFRMSLARVRAAALTTAGAAILIGTPIGLTTGAPAGAMAQSAHTTTALTPSCTAAVCNYSLGVNPGLLAGKPFACPAIQHAVGTVTIINRFRTGQPADTMTVSA